MKQIIVPTITQAGSFLSGAPSLSSEGFLFLATIVGSIYSGVFSTPPEPEPFDRMRDVYKEYFPDGKPFEASLAGFKAALQCGWEMAGVVPYAQQSIKAVGALGFLLGAFALTRKKVRIYVITPPASYLRLLDESKKIGEGAP